jgi:hypothetical protein
MIQGLLLTAVTLTVSGLTPNQVIGAYDLRVLFNSSIVTAQSIVLLGTLGPVGDNLTATSVGTPGQADAAEVSFATIAALTPLQATQPFGIFRITFLGSAVGTSALTFANAPRVLSDGNGNTISGVIVNTGSITVVSNGNGGEIPEPGTWVLMTGTLALLGLGRLRK